MKRAFEPEALDLLEESLRLLRRQRVSTLACHAVGTLPFVVALWFFWSDMSRSAAARDRCVAGAFGMALAFVWMRAWHLVFVCRLRAELTGQADEAWSWSAGLRALAVQWCVQPWQLLVLPVTLVIAVPFPWAVAFFENVAVLGAQPGARTGEVCRRAWQQALRWPAQNATLVSVLALFGLAILVNLQIGLGQVPALLKAFFGIETAFTHSAWALLNTTFLAVCGGLTYVCLDPLLKAVYVLRCFHGESIRSGEDLRAELRRWSPLAAWWLAAALVLGNTADVAARGAAASQPPELAAVLPATLAPASLDRAIQEVLQHPKYSWRFPREEAAESAATNRGFLGNLVEGVLDWVKESGKTMGRWLERPMKWVGDILEAAGRKLFGRGWRPPMPGGPMDIAGALQLLLWLILVVILAAVLLLALRAWRRRGALAPSALARVPPPDLRSEDVSAAQLPEDEWLRLAEEMLHQGERRLALRALHLAALARLAGPGWIRVARHKSNRDYEQELRRRTPEWPDVHSAFAENVGLFDASWYGCHEVTDGRLERFRFNLGQIQTCGERMPSA